MAKVNDGLIYGLDVFKFNGKELGYISEDGLEWGGDKPEKVKINAAQVKNGPVKVITKGVGTNVITFKLIQLMGTNCKDVMGGDVDAQGNYTPSPTSTALEGSAEIKCDSGHTITISRAVLSAKPAGKISGSELFSIDCELEILVPTDGTAPYKILAPADEPAENPQA